MKQDLYDKIVTYIVEHQNQFYRLAYSYVRSREDALDVVQNGVCQALEHYKDLRNEDAVKTWFYRILVNESLRFLKDKGFEMQDDLNQYISRLDGDTQTIIRLRFFEELSLKEIADITEMNLNTVKAKLYRGLKQLKVNVLEVDV